MMDPMLALDLGFGALGALITFKRQAAQDNHNMLMAHIKGASDSAEKLNACRVGLYYCSDSCWVLVVIGEGR